MCALQYGLNQRVWYFNRQILKNNYQSKNDLFEDVPYFSFLFSIDRVQSIIPKIATHQFYNANEMSVFIFYYYLSSMKILIGFLTKRKFNCTNANLHSCQNIESGKATGDKIKIGSLVDIFCFFYINK